MLRRAIQVQPHQLDLLNNLQIVLTEGGDTKGTEQVLRKLIEEEPTVFDHRLKLARFYDQQKAMDKAEAVLQEATKLFQKASSPGWPWPIS